MFSLKRLLVTVTLAVSLQFSYAQKLTVHPVTDPKVDPARLERIDKLIQQYVDSGWINGATAFVSFNGKTIYHKGIGYDDIEKKTALPKDAIMRIASQTKAITSVAVMMLYEEGKFLLDDAISKYIPSFKNPKVLDQFNEADSSYTTKPAKSEITIRHLLTHTSGLQYAQIGSKPFVAIYAKAGLIAGIGIDKLVLGDAINKLGSLPLAHHPGEKYTYGLNTDVLGYLVEVLSGQRLDQFLRTRLFDPLGMNDTYFYLPPSKYNRLATLYTEDEKKKLRKAPEMVELNGKFYNNYPAYPGTYFSGGGGLASTAYDYGIFMQMLLNGGTYNGKRILSPHTIRLMTSNQIGDIHFSKGNHFGLGFEVVTPKGSSHSPLPVGTFSWGGMFSSSYWIDPANKIGGQLFLQIFPYSHGDIHEKFKIAVYQALSN